MPSVDKLREWCLLALLEVSDNLVEIVMMPRRIGLPVFPDLSDNFILIFHWCPPVRVLEVCIFPDMCSQQ